jgi:type I restriction enzyme S subunit
MEWLEVSLNDLVDEGAPICYGIVLPGLNHEDGVPVVKVKNIFKGTVETQGLVKTSPEIAAQYRRSSLNGGDILLSIRGTVGRVGIVPGELTGANITQDTARIRISCRDTRDYVFQLLQSELLQKQIRKHVVGQAVKGINIRDVKRIKLPFPDKTEAQHFIAEIFANANTAIEKTELLVAAKEKHFLWFSKKLLFGDATDTANTAKNTKWFSVPDHWKVVNIGKIAKEVSAFNNSAENIPVLSCTKYDGLVDSLTYFNKQVFSLDTSTYKVVTKGQFAYATNHIEEGSIGYQDVYDKGLVSPMYTVFETNENVDDSYLYKVLKSVVYLHIFRANTSSSVDRRGSLRWKEFAKLPIPLPPIEEQKQIAAILTTARQEIDLLKKQAEAYRRQKRGLMQKLLTGEWRVKLGGDEYGLGTD